MSAAAPGGLPIHTETTPMNYFCKTNDDDRPIGLFRADGEVEQAWTINGWQPAPGFLEDVVASSFDYGPITEADARVHFPAAFA